MCDMDQGTQLTERQQLKLLLSDTVPDPQPPRQQKRPSFVYASSDSDSDSDPKPAPRTVRIMDPQPAARSAVKPSRPLAAASRIGVLPAKKSSGSVSPMSSPSPPLPAQDAVIPPLGSSARPCAVCLSCVSPAGSSLRIRCGCTATACQVFVHQDCYGVRHEARHAWFCDKCYAIERYRAAHGDYVMRGCVLCGLFMPTDAMRRVVMVRSSDPPEFVHVACAIAFSDSIVEVPSQTPYNPKAPMYQVPESLRIRRLGGRALAGGFPRQKKHISRALKAPVVSVAPATPPVPTPPSNTPPASPPKPAPHQSQRKRGYQWRYPAKAATDGEWSGIESHSDEETAHWYHKHGKYKQRKSNDSQAAVTPARVPVVVEATAPTVVVPALQAPVAPAREQVGTVGDPNPAPRGSQARPHSHPVPRVTSPSPSQAVLPSCTELLTTAPQPSVPVQFTDPKQYCRPSFALPGEPSTNDTSSMTSLQLRQSEGEYLDKLGVLRLLWDRRKSDPCYAVFDPGNCIEVESLNVGSQLQPWFSPESLLSTTIRPGSVVLTSGGLSLLHSVHKPAA
jgi:PHD-finger